MSVKFKTRYIKLVKLGMLPYDVLICQGMTVAEMKKYVERRYGLELESGPPGLWSERQQGKTLHLETHQTIIWLKHPPKIAPWTFAHEAVHAMHMILDTCGIETSQKNDELVAYGVEHIVRSVLE